MDCLVGFYKCDSLIIAIPPSDEYLDVLEDVFISVSLDQAIDTQMIFLSSSSFYDGKKSIIEAEELVKVKDENAVILRLGGLMGYDRVAGKYTASKTIKDGPTNYVHRDDTVAIIQSVIEQNIRNKIFDVVAPIQARKKDIFIENSKKFNFPQTYFEGEEKIIVPLSSEIICDVLGYEFQKKDVKNFWD
jgi:hypothetical protein